MQAFKLFFKILRSNRTSILVYVLITVAMAVLFVKTQSMSVGDLQTSDAKPSIVIYDASKSEESKAFVQYMKDRTTIVDIKEDKLEDSMYYQQVSYALYIPASYDENIRNHQTIQLEKKSIANVAGAYLVNQYIEEYASSLQSYTKHLPQASFKEINSLMKKDFSKQVKMDIQTKEAKEQVQAYFSFYGYTLLCCVITGVGYAMYVLSKKSIKSRNMVAPIQSVKMNIQLIAAYTIFSLAIAALAVGFGYILFPLGMQEAYVPYMILNMLVFLVPTLGISFLIGSLVRSVEAQNGIANVLCLALAFLGGSFVPQDLMSESLLRISAFTPNYWFVKNNELLFVMNDFNYEQLKPVILNMGILILFGLAFIFVALVIQKQKTKSIS